MDLNSGRDQEEESCIRLEADPERMAEGRAIIRGMEASVDNHAELLKLMANGVRLKILLLLCKLGPLCVCDLSDMLGMKIAAISQHLRKMRDGGLLRKDRKGATLYYFPREERRDLIEQVLQQLEDGSEEMLKDEEK